MYTELTALTGHIEICIIYKEYIGIVLVAGSEGVCGSMCSSLFAQNFYVKVI